MVKKKKLLRGRATGIKPKKFGTRRGTVATRNKSGLFTGRRIVRKKKRPDVSGFRQGSKGRIFGLVKQKRKKKKT